MSYVAPMKRSPQTFRFGNKSNGALELSLNIVDELLQSPRIRFTRDTVSNKMCGRYFAEALRLAPAFCDEFVAPLPEAGGIIDFESAVGGGWGHMPHLAPLND